MQISKNYLTLCKFFNIVEIILRYTNHSQWLQNHSVLYKSFSIEVIQRSVPVVQSDNNQPSLHLIMLSFLKLIQWMCKMSIV